MFKEQLQKIVDKTEGGLAVIVMDMNGIALDTYAKDGAPFDINTVSIELSTVLGAAKRASEMLEAGKTSEIAVSTEKLTTIVRTLNETYFLAFAMKPDGNVGKGRYLMRMAAPEMAKEL